MDKGVVGKHDGTLFSHEKELNRNRGRARGVCSAEGGGFQGSHWGHCDLGLCCPPPVLHLPGWAPQQLAPAQVLHAISTSAAR